MNIAVEIESGHYTLPPKTVKICRRLKKARDDSVGEPTYKSWIKQLEILLGREAVEKLFPSGDDENLDRMELIYIGVMNAFDTTVNARREDRNARVAREIADMELKLRPLRELIEAVSGECELIERPVKTG